MLAMLVYFTVSSGEAALGRARRRAADRARPQWQEGRRRPATAGAAEQQEIALVRARATALGRDNDPDLIEDVRRQGEIARAGGALDERFSVELRDVRAILANRRRSKAAACGERKNLTKTPEKSSHTPAKNL